MRVKSGFKVFRTKRTLTSKDRPYLSLLIRRHGVLGGLLQLLPDLELGEIAVVVRLHLEKKNLGVSGAGGGGEVRLDEAKNPTTDRGDIGLDAGAVVLDDGGVFLVPPALLLLDERDHPPGVAVGADEVLVGDGQEVALLRRELLQRRHLEHQLIH